MGASAIYAVTRDFNWMLEATQEWNEDVVDGAIDHDNAFTISPGFRTAINLEGGTQIVIGAAAPIRFSDAPVDYGVYLYFSVEHHVSALGH